MTQKITTTPTKPPLTKILSPRKKNKNHYFTSVHENAIVKYAATDDLDLRTQLYIEYIQPAFDQMVDKIIYTYRFTTLPNIDYLKSDCKVWLTTILNKYDPNKGSKAFSYFSVVTKNWFIHKVKKTQKRNRTEVLMDDMINQLEEDLISTEPTYDFSNLTSGISFAPKLF